MTSRFCSGFSIFALFAIDLWPICADLGFEIIILFGTVMAKKGSVAVGNASGVKGGDKMIGKDHLAVKQVRAYF